MSDIRISTERGSITPTDLLDSNLFSWFETLRSSLSDEDLVKNLGDIPAKKLEVAVTEFIDLVMFTSSLEHKEYFKTRLLRLKSVEKVLWEIEKYAPLILDKTEDIDLGGPLGTNPLKTRYSPRLLKVVIDSLTITNLAENFVEIIDTMFANLLYFLEYELDINELIYNITVDIQKTIVGYRYSAHKIVNLDVNFNN